MTPEAKLLLLRAFNAGRDHQMNIGAPSFDEWFSINWDSIIESTERQSEFLKCDYCCEPFGVEHEENKYACKDCRNSW